MQKTKLEDLRVVIGRPYLFVHQGDCEHAVIFTKIWRIHSDDKQYKNYYPLTTFAGPLRKKKCKICEVFHASYIVVNHKMVDQNPFTLCKKCFESFNYDANGQKLYDFQVFEYFHE